MRIGVLGDTHNCFPNVERIVAMFREATVERVVHTGDITQPRVLDLLATLEVPVLGVYGNNDLGERHRLERRALEHGMTLTDPPEVVEWAGRRILVAHDPVEAEIPVAQEVDLILHGHTHRYREERLGDTLIFNPGECAGFLAGGNSVGVIDLLSLDAQRLRF